MKLGRAILGLFVFAYALSACVPLGCNKEECLKILFIGNSYTYENDLPNTFASLARSGNHQVQTAMLAQGGWTLTDHLASTEFSEAMQFEQWDYVILQEQSQIPSVEASRTQSMYPAARALVERIRENGAQPIFFETWGHRNGYSENGMSNYEAMQYELNQGYTRIASELDSSLAPVGLAWFRALTENPSLELWRADGSHPSEQGTYLAACVFYATIYHESPQGLSYRGNIPEDIARQLQDAAHSVLLDP